MDHTTMPASPSLQTLIKKLREMFQLDRGDLDFGIYRIMNFRRAEIDGYLNRELPRQVRDVLAGTGLAGQGDLRRQLDETVAKARALGVDPDTVPAVRELKERLSREPDLTAVEDEIHSHLFKFFNRYYDEGDFISQRRARDGAYLIPYEGQEVKLHWANHDQYYVKSSESFTNYTFRLPPDQTPDPDGSARRVRFRVVAAESERDNNKAAKDKQRRFVLAEDEPVTIEDGDLIVRFTYRAAEEKTKQDALNAATAEALLGLDVAAAWAPGLAAPAPTPGNEGRRVIDRHLAAFTARNTFDYFIHKDLRRFLLRELDQYVKDEVVSLDALEAAAAEEAMGAGDATLKAALARSRAMRAIARKIITFLAQIEEFQKKLWLKKKFIIETQWCVTLDRVPEDLYPEIAANDAQRAEWVRLFAIDAIEADLAGAVGYSEPLTVAFLKANPFLVLDTRHFDEAFTARLLASFDDVDGQTDGLLVHGENFGALRLLRERYKNSVKAQYIDPPYNTGKDDFHYKDSYQHASWLSMISNRMEMSADISAMDGVIFISIDDTELYRMQTLLEDTFGSSNWLGTIIWHNATDNNPTNISVEHEYIVCFARDRSALEPVWSSSASPVREKIIEKAEELISQYGNDQRALSSAYANWFRENKSHLWPFQEYDQIDINGVFTGSRSVHNPGKEGYFYDVLHPKTKKPCKPPLMGYRFAPETMDSLLSKGRIIFGSDETKIIEIKIYIQEYKAKFSSYIDIDGRRGANQLRALFSSKTKMFANPKPGDLISDMLSFCTRSGDVVVDYFAGTGTTGQSLIELKRLDGGGRKYILVEVGPYFDLVLVPRLEKAVYAGDWKDGKPVSRDGISHCLKVIRLESYEDALDNLRLERRASQADFLDGLATPDGHMHPMRVEYLLSRMLDEEMRGNASLLDLDRFRDPTAYTLTVARDGEPREVRVDLMETFNYLIGLTVRHIEAPRRFRAELERSAAGRLSVTRRGLRQNPDGPWWFRWLTGTLTDGRKALIIWRTLTDNPEQDNAVLDAFVERIALNTREAEFDVVWVNGDNNLQNLRLTIEEAPLTPTPLPQGERGFSSPDFSPQEENSPDTLKAPLPSRERGWGEGATLWKVRLIEDDFHRLMFADVDA